MSGTSSWKEELEILLCDLQRDRKERKEKKSLHKTLITAKPCKNILAIAPMGKLSLKPAGRLRIAKSELEYTFPTSSAIQ